MMTTVAFAEVPTPVGPFVLAVTERGLVASGWGSRAGLAGRLGLAEVHDADRTASVVAELHAYFAGDLRTFTTPVDWRLMSGSRLQVLQALHKVPYGTAVTYGELARRAGSTVPARGIGSIMGSNPIPIVVPCHRVIAGNGLGGFSGGEGVETKRRLLTHEGYLQPTLLDL
ncbi:MAG: methylated-DNA--[protein]-cysteine S-methyltransferase [Nonomuraea sp.]|nr:methylated-DNA--[protein]-cysteine S-methyltransferase [Nonomuraea sp.]NUP65043.1 methylated-DNA--[protein]-cysteine S-methyltransferase [Nonomuraea sp.]NUP76530.1 methylated-DNA--[protein]-cysteine S-methyltransferase [Nonomuraea sp.]NUS07211.1 methylated-DNA--[protein]-cysteine S-methyltransferase [Nonomuraea sp.]NUT41096.1 methylated-DNA--[protein]-cysteine S-methyltransferase [Thermoactinospora sp.]